MRNIVKQYLQHSINILEAAYQTTLWRHINFQFAPVGARSEAIPQSQVDDAVLDRSENAV